MTLCRGPEGLPKLGWGSSRVVGRRCGRAHLPHNKGVRGAKPTQLRPALLKTIFTRLELELGRRRCNKGTCWTEDVLMMAFV